MPDLDEIRNRLIGTNIDPRSFLSTDYFNHFNEVIMLFTMLPDMPEMLDEIDKWQYKTYHEHFRESSLGFAPLAMEVYEYSPPDLRERFDRLVLQMKELVEESRVLLRRALEEGDRQRFNELAMQCSMQLQGMIDDGGAIVHGYGASADQEKIDKMF